MKQKAVIYLSTLVLVLVALSACAGADSSEPPAAEPQAVTIEGHDIRYEPQTIEVRVGQPVQLTFANHGSLEHDVTFERLPVAGDEVTALSEAAGHEHEEDAEHEHEEDAEHEHEEEAEHEHEEDAEHEHEEEAEHEHEEDAEHEGDGGASEEGSHTHENAAMHVHTVAGEEVTVTFTPTEPGTYEFYCSVDDHREAGMVGTLIVSEG